ncbi:MAG TPA: alpha-amylase family glycosyl hydrolase [Anaerolineaceae bacterium]|nr:alpha-amylase family glycosyl hydrolase [Anaerolineaceae bacterium]
MEKKRLWWKDGIIYQIYPRSFKDTNADGIGDLAGIIDSLDYIKDLGVDAIWLSPIYPSPDKDFGYDVADYLTIDPKYGNLQDFDHLIAEAHKRDLHIIMDLVLNHTSDQHRWFVESRKSPDNPYHDWYLWRDPAPDGGPPNNWLSHFGGPGWEYDRYLNKYYFHMFEKYQPDLNWRNPEVRAMVMKIFRYWLDKGVDGFRLDVFNAYYKDADLRDNPRKKGLARRPFEAYEHIYDKSQPEMMDVVKEIRSILDEYPERYVVGETFLEGSTYARTFVGKDRFHAAFDFNFASRPWNAKAFGTAIQYWDALHGDEAWPNYFFNNHDVPRSATRYTNNEDDSRLKLLATMLLTVRGTPYIYYGEEIGMRDIKVARKDIQDPPGKRYWPFYKGRDGCRSPMQWNATVNAGFGTGKSWLPVHPNHTVRNVANQQSSPASLLNFYKALIQVRRKHPSLHAGDIQLIPVDNQYLLVYLRRLPEETSLVILNFSRDIQQFELPIKEVNEWDMVFNGNDSITSHMSETSVSLPAYGMAILVSRLAL